MDFWALLPPHSVRVLKATTPEKSRPVQRAALSAAAPHGVGARSWSQPLLQLFGERRAGAGRSVEVKEVEVLTDVTPPGAGSPKFTAAKSLGILSFTAGRVLWPSFRG